MRRSEGREVSPAGRSEATREVSPAGRSEATRGSRPGGQEHRGTSHRGIGRWTRPLRDSVGGPSSHSPGHCNRDRRRRWGSSGRLRSELDIVPPGDLRMALAALASDSPHGRLWATIIQHRLSGSGALAGHPIGNLLLAGLNEVLADPVAALDEVGRLLGLNGRVLPMPGCAADRGRRIRPGE